mgnify:CR=1 FL=1
MKNKYKIILIICIIIGICSILVGSIAYYRIVVEGSIKGSTGNAVFVLKDENSNVWNNKEINLGKVNPGDSGEFTVTMDASGSTVDMYATLEIERTNLPTNLKFYTTPDHKSELHKYYSLLEKSGTSSETLTIYWYWNPYIDDIEDSKFINVSNLEANIRVSAVQISEYAMMKNGNGVTSSDRMYFWKDNYRPYIRTITFGNDLSNLPSSCTEENLCFDVTGDGNTKKVYGYLIDSGLKDSNNPEQSLYNLYIVSEAPIFAPADCSLFFAGFNSLVNINYNNNFNTSKVTNMSYMFLPATSGDWGDIVTLTVNNKNVKPSFVDRKNDGEIEMMKSGGGGVGFYSVIEKLDLSNFNTSQVTNMYGMFGACSSLISLDLSNFNTSQVTNMYGMFSDCSSLTSLDLSGFNTSNVTNMNVMFVNCSSLTSLDLNSFNTSKVTDMYEMFRGCSSLTSLDLSSFNTSNVTNMGDMFVNCSSLTSLDLSGFNTSKVTDMYGMFSYCQSLTSLDLSNFNTLNVINMCEMFRNCSSLTSLDLSSFNTSKVTNINYMFSNCTSLISLDLRGFNALIDDENSHAFSSCTSLKYLDISNCYFSDLRTLLSALKDCTNLITTINITNFGYSVVYVFNYLTSAKLTINYTSNCEANLDAYLAAHPDYNWVKGKLITAPSSN